MYRSRCINESKNVEKTKLADEIIVEEYDGQKLIDIQKHEIDILQWVLIGLVNLII